jgi:hypothetical protein
MLLTSVRFPYFSASSRKFLRWTSVRRFNMPGEILTRWTIRLALVCYAAFWALPPRSVRWWKWSRAAWTLGCVLFVVHVACAFHFYYAWSHAAAWKNTAEQTEALLGVAVGDGVYFSYLFLILWVADVCWIWRQPDPFGLPPGGSPATSASAGASGMPPSEIRRFWPLWRIAVHLFMAFIAVNGAIVFEAGLTRWAGLAAVLALLGLAVGRSYKWRPRNALAPPQNQPDGAA